MVFASVIVQITGSDVVLATVPSSSGVVSATVGAVVSPLVSTIVPIC